MSQAPSRKQVAILGGGAGAMAAAFGLTETPHWQDHYDITGERIAYFSHPCSSVFICGYFFRSASEEDRECPVPQSPPTSRPAASNP